MESNHLSQLNSKSLLSKILIPLTWGMFLINAYLLIFYFSEFPSWTYENLIQINGFSIVIWTVVSFFTAIIQMYSSNYMKGFKKKKSFLLLCLAFSLSVMLFVISNHVVLLVLFWFLMGLIMSKLIGIDSDWKEAQHASKFARSNYFGGVLFFTIGIALLAFSTDSFTRTNILSNLASSPKWILTLASLFIIVAAIIQSAIFPFHRWLLSAMTAPTPASALMHAGFVNGAGILLTLFAPLFFEANVLLLIFIIGGVTAIVAQFSKLLQVNVKQKLACSTIAQMSFMVMQCGLGFFTAAITHLILHGFYKAYLFLSAGEEVKNSLPKPSAKMVIKPLQALVITVSAILGGLLFGLITGKGLGLDSGLFLTFIVAITVGQVVYNIINHANISALKKGIITPLLIIVGIGVYALVFNGVTLLMYDMPMANVAIALTPVHIIFGIVFLVAFHIMLSGVYRKIPWLYVKLMNISQPLNKSVVSFKTK
ncbi:MAG: proton-conducting transporter membrane subunit [Algibacter sp.]|uniref:proton-conducting transporter transmembrane domain-containing protein n=1 Tax=Algibacter sp. TaxID=1872428 RepID=UPI00261BE0B4|nr:proton-conducting transporter membrane subunit [Algibacter sp.]MDG1728789.1 proton-conducting transporter membrane subunit [Algibacter sp.]MDG2178313.1 proton-conducting transporter membrane subunit [Algibacter sp.]